MQGSDNMENLPLFKLTIKEDETAIQEVNAVALVDIPAIGENFFAFSKELFVDPGPTESKEEFIPRCIEYMVGEGKEQEQAAAICYSIWEEQFGGEGSGCHGDNCGRPAGSGGNDISDKSIKIAENDDRFKSYSKGNNIQKTIDAYSNRGYQVNYDIRDGISTPEIDAFIKNMDNALDKMPEHKGKVYRGLKDKDGNILKSLKNNIGSELQWNGYTSTSKDIKVTEKFGKDILFHIESKNGKDISKTSQRTWEKEVVFKRNTSFIIESIDGNNVFLKEK